jgi:uncharacterized membrane protein YedE/YeeE
MNNNEGGGQMTFAYAMPLIGGALIGAAASLLLALARETAGISGIVEGLLHPTSGRPWRAAFVAGLLLGGLLLAILAPGHFGAAPRPLGVVAVAGLLVGFGTRMGGGCTSGHGVCGISRWSRPSMVATATFIATGIVTVLFYRMLTGAGS